MTSFENSISFINKKILIIFQGLASFYVPVCITDYINRIHINIQAVSRSFSRLFRAKQRVCGW